MAMSATSTLDAHAIMITRKIRSGPVRALSRLTFVSSCLLALVETLTGASGSGRWAAAHTGGSRPTIRSVRRRITVPTPSAASPIAPSPGSSGLPVEASTAALLLPPCVVRPGSVVVVTDGAHVVDVVELDDVDDVLELVDDDDVELVDDELELVEDVGAAVVDVALPHDAAVTPPAAVVVDVVDVVELDEVDDDDVELVDDDVLELVDDDVEDVDDDVLDEDVLELVDEDVLELVDVVVAANAMSAHAWGCVKSFWFKPR